MRFALKIHGSLEIQNNSSSKKDSLSSSSRNRLSTSMNGSSCSYQ